MVQKSGVQQLRLVVFPVIYREFYTSQVVQDFFHQQQLLQFCPKASRKGNQKSHVLAMTSPPTLICTLFNGEKGWELQGPNVNIVDTCKFI